jgi:GNAT superfamily N-acetyltransferase
VTAGLRIRPADPREGARLREIAVAAKSHWGYDPEQVERWAADGDFSPKGMTDKEVYVAEADGRAVGWASLIATSETCRLDDLWVEPGWIGKGVGSRLFRHAAAPHAVGFYERMGARRLRDSEPSAWGRVIPVMGIDLVRRRPGGYSPGLRSS